MMKNPQTVMGEKLGKVAATVLPVGQVAAFVRWMNWYGGDEKEGARTSEGALAFLLVMDDKRAKRLMNDLHKLSANATKPLYEQMHRDAVILARAQLTGRKKAH